MTVSYERAPFFRQHSLSLTALGRCVAHPAVYVGGPSTHLGSFYGNAVADWTGGCVTIVMTQFLYEKGSAESQQPKGKIASAVLELMREHSLTIILIVTGVGWILAFRPLNPNSKWGQVVGNLVSEWTQILGLVLMTKRLIEIGSKT